ncbi:DUF3575 domain-containing protein [Sphingobacterium gobiense]|uniref:DUF3575 domain-containing protein n=1 Tax=Sphingobacterium gobiense TaxID=1382456 RepID=A0A2S9JUM2_9SPHI|nr:DUF3575 domain-containing protein [Sphingobacterium gobiense]PRD56987.1 DUF3575 domain-containing protein [Sphingobacterium gobiense]
MNKLLITLLFVSILTPFLPNAQTLSPKQNGRKNIVKFNTLTLLGGKFSFEYEHLLTDRITVGTALSLRPKKGLPFSSTVKNTIDDEELNDLIDNFKSSNFSITPEIRFYASRRGPFRGFYIAPYVKYASYGASLPYDFEVDVEDQGTGYYSRTETIPLNGSIQAFTAGISFGTHFKLARNIYLDWRILGPGYGTSKGAVSGKMNLNTEEQSALRESMEELKADMGDLPLGIILDYEVNDNGADIKILRSPWASIRTGFSIGYRF